MLCISSVALHVALLRLLPVSSLTGLKQAKISLCYNMQPSLGREIEKQLISENIVPLSLAWLGKQVIPYIGSSTVSLDDAGNWLSKGDGENLWKQHHKKPVKRWKKLSDLLLLSSFKTFIIFSFVQNTHYFNRFSPLLGKRITITFDCIASWFF